jgi:hypothetical protein
MLNSIISTANIVDEVIGALAMRSTSTHGPVTKMKFHATEMQASTFHFDQMPLTTWKKNSEIAAYLALGARSMVHFVQSIIDIGILFGQTSPIVTSESLFTSISLTKVTEMIRLSGEARAERVKSSIRSILSSSIPSVKTTRLSPI